MLQGIKALVAACVLAGVLLLPAQALGQSEVTNDPYDDSSVAVVDEGDPADPGSPAWGGNSHSGGLPFTGLDIGLVAAMGGGLALAGLGMRRLTRRPNTA